MDNLKPCPFCGSNKAVIQKDSGFFYMFYVGCNECGASGSYSKTSENAIKAWNERQAEKELSNGK